LFKEICSACNNPTDEHSIEKLIACMEKILKTWDDAVKKLPHNSEFD